MAENYINVCEYIKDTANLCLKYNVGANLIDVVDCIRTRRDAVETIECHTKWSWKKMFWIRVCRILDPNVYL
jgi:hypothetical protein